jgi:uncharacterized integral membrane protein
MYFSLIVTFILLMFIIVAGIQNTMPVDLKFLTWKYQISVMGLIFYSALIGGAIIAVISLPKLVSKSLKVKRLTNEIHKLKMKTADLERRHEEE